MAPVPDEKTIKVRIGSVIEERRSVRGLSEVDLARTASVDDRQMHRVLRGESGLSIYSLARVAAALGWTLGELMYVAFPPIVPGRARVGARQPSNRTS